MSVAERVLDGSDPETGAAPYKTGSAVARTADYWRFRMVQIGISFVVMAAAGLKAQQALDEIGLGGRWLRAGEISVEVGLGLWLVIGGFRRAAWWTTLGCFCCFVCIALYKSLSGAESCGCFGAVKVNPRYTLVLDIGIVAALLWARGGHPRSKVPDAEIGGVRRKPRRWPFGEIPRASLAAALGLVAGVGVWYFQPRATQAGVSGLEHAGKWLVLAPEKWLANRFPLVGEIDIGPQLARGQWIVVLYHADCDTCRKAIPVYAALEAGSRNLESGRGREDPGTRVCYVEMPPYANAADDPLRGIEGIIRGRLSDRHEWFATTPVVVEMSDGLIVRAAAGEAATNLKWRK